MKHFEIEINQFIDNELDNEDQKQLFQHLSKCDDCRNLLTDYIEMKNETRSFYEKMEYESGNNNLIIPVVKKNNNYKYGFYFAAASVVVLALFLLFNVGNKSDDKAKYAELQTKFITLENNYNLLLTNRAEDENSEKINGTQEIHKNAAHNKLISTQNNGKKKKTPQESIQESEPKISNKNELALLKEERMEYGYSEYIKSLPTEKITEDDFLTPQIIGN